MAIQAIQVPKVISPLIIFTFSFGFDLWIHASATVVGDSDRFLRLESVLRQCTECSC